MKKVFYIILFALAISADVALAGDIKTDLSTAVWSNMLDLPDVLARSKDASKYSDLEVCFYAGKYSQEILSTIAVISYRLDPNFNEYQNLQNAIGTTSFSNVVRINHDLQNLASTLASYCQSKLDRSALNADLVRIYRGHLTVYRILEPSDAGRAFNNVNGLNFLSPIERSQIIVPIANTSELGDISPSPIK